MRFRALLPALALALAATAFSTAPAHAERGERSLVEVLARDGARLDRNWNDFDIVEKAALTVLDAKPDSPVGLLAQGEVKLTAFLPTDRAFQRLVEDLAGERLNERQTFRAVASLGVDTVETVLLYHVVPGPPITYYNALRADGATLTTAAGLGVKVDVRGRSVFLRDKDADDTNPRVIRSFKNINRGNKQIAHGINRVLRPVDL